MPVPNSPFSPLPGSGAPKIPSVGGGLPFSTQPVTPPGVANAGGSSTWGKVGGWLLDNWDKLLTLGLGAYTTKEAIQNAQAANDYTEKALGMAGEDYASRGQFRDQAAAKLGATRPDLSGMFADSGNPYSRSRIPAVGGAPPSGPFVPTPSVGGVPTNGIAPQIAPIGGAPSGQPHGIPINPAPASGPISGGPQNRPPVMPTGPAGNAPQNVPPMDDADPNADPATEIMRLLRPRDAMRYRAPSRIPVVGGY